MSNPLSSGPETQITLGSLDEVVERPIQPSLFFPMGLQIPVFQLPGVPKCLSFCEPLQIDLRHMLSVHFVAEAQAPPPIFAYHSDQTPSSLTILFCSLPLLSSNPYARKLILTRASLLLCRVCQKASPPPL